MSNLIRNEPIYFKFTSLAGAVFCDVIWFFCNNKMKINLLINVYLELCSDL